MAKAGVELLFATAQQAISLLVRTLHTTLSTNQQRCKNHYKNLKYDLAEA